MRYFKGSYDPDLCCALLDEYQTGGRKDRAILQELLLQVAPLIGLVAKYEVRGHVPGETIETLMCDALEKIFEMIECGLCDLPADDPTTLKSFLYTAAKRAMIDTLRMSRQQMFDCWELCYEPHQTRLSSYIDVENRLYLLQIREIAKSLFNHDLRFSGKEREACEYMAMCIMGFTKADPMSAQHRFRLTRGKTKKLLQLTQIRIKTAYYVVRELDART